jgi:hypothetical protein
MTRKRMALTIAVAFVVSEVLATIIHGFVLAGDYAPYYGSLLRGADGGPPVQMLLLPVAHLCFIVGLVWIYARLPLAGSSAVRGLKIGVLGWLVGQVPLWLLWYAEQPWPGALVSKQLALELVSSLVIGSTIAFVAGERAARPPQAA